MNSKIPMLLKDSSDIFSVATQVLQRLKKAGYIAYFAGGCVRDLILGLRPKDYDIVTNASPDEVQVLFVKTVLVGAQFGVIRVIESGHEFEVAQFRQESDYQDGRHPSRVSFSTPEQDAFRRDFTINAMFYDPFESVLYDYVQGLEDLRQQKIKAVGEARIRFQEDHLRILRALRFRSQFGFQWDPSLIEALKNCASLVAKVSRERVRDEYLKMRFGEHFMLVLRSLIEYKILDFLFPALNFQITSFVPVRSVLEESAWWELGLWAMQSGSSYSSTVSELGTLRLSRAENRSLVQFLSWFDQQQDWKNESVGSLIERSFAIGARDGLILWLEKNPSVFANEKKLFEVLRRHSLPPRPWLTAQDFSQLSGPTLGRALKMAYHLQLESETSDLDSRFVDSRESLLSDAEVSEKEKFVKFVLSKI